MGQLHTADWGVGRDAGMSRMELKEPTMESKLITMTEAALAGADAHRATLLLDWEQVLRDRDEARAQVRALADANQRKEEFLGIVAHEIRAPATNSSLAVALVGRRLDSLLAQLTAADVEFASQVAVIRDLLRPAEHNMNRLVALVADLLDLSRMWAGRFELRLTRCDLAALVEEAVEEQR